MFDWDLLVAGRQAALLVFTKIMFIFWDLGMGSGILFIHLFLIVYVIPESLCF